MYKRLLSPLKSNSFFMFGARGTGKSTLVQSLLSKNAKYVDLLDDEIYDRLLQQPKLLENWCESKKYEWIIIDEVQRLPKLLNTAHRMIEKHKQKFALTGSSSRKLKRGAGNLLAGRAFVNNLYPLSFMEIGKDFDLNHALRWGTLPKTVLSETDEDRKAYLRSYTLTYVKEEIVSEQIVRKLEPFRDFLTVAAQCSGQIINYSNIANDVGSHVPTVQTYFQILEETYIGFTLPHYHKSVRKSQLHSPKFYFFDNGVKKSLEGSLDSVPTQGTYEYGALFESLIIQEVFRLNEYFHKDYRLSYFRTKNDAEVDLVLSKGKEIILIEIKSANRVDEVAVRKLARLREAFSSSAQAFYLSCDEESRSIDGVRCLHWRQFLKQFVK